MDLDYELYDDFLIESKAKLNERNERYGASWKIDNVDTLFHHLMEEYKEALDELQNSNYRGLSEEMIDIANCAILVWYACRRDLGVFK